MDGVSQPARAIEDVEIELGGRPVFYRRAARAAGEVLYLHGVPTSCDDWLPFLRANGGLAVDLPGFGRTYKAGDGDYSIPGYADFLEAFLDHLGVERLSLVVHDWGAAGLAFAQRHPQRIERLVVINAVPLLPGYRWHFIARQWRRRGVGELVMGAQNRWVARRLSRQATTLPGGLPREMLDAAWSHFDYGTQRAILRLYRSAGPDVLAAAGADLRKLECAALVLWGDEDPFIGSEFADRYGEALPNATVEHISGANHWPWIDDPSVVGRVARFLA